MMVNNQWIHIYNQEIDGAMWSRKLFLLKSKINHNDEMPNVANHQHHRKTLHEIDHKINNDHEE